MAVAAIIKKEGHITHCYPAFFGVGKLFRTEISTVKKQFRPGIINICPNHL